MAEKALKMHVLMPKNAHLACFWAILDNPFLLNG
jgi:hypothetical protein